MSDVAAHLVDEILPEVPLRHWICSLPWRLRCAAGFDRHLCADVLGAFSGALERSLRRRAKKALGLRSVEQAITGAVTFIQRGDSALRLNPHFHTIALDGVYVRGEDGELRFHPLDPPSWEDVAQVATWAYEKLTRVLVHHGRSLEGLDELPDALASEHPVLASCYGASAGDRQLEVRKAHNHNQPRSGHPTRLNSQRAKGAESRRAAKRPSFRVSAKPRAK